MTVRIVLWLLMGVLLGGVPAHAQVWEETPCEELRLSLNIPGLTTTCYTLDGALNDGGINAGRYERIDLESDYAGGFVTWMKMYPGTYLDVLSMDEFFGDMENMNWGAGGQSKTTGFKFWKGQLRIETDDGGYEDVSCLAALKNAGKPIDRGVSQRVAGFYCNGRVHPASDTLLVQFLRAIQVDDLEYRNGVNW
ncbi:MAG: hypothetical protein ACPGO3_06055 [Magnetospiraceae bacterium]